MRRTLAVMAPVVIFAAIVACHGRSQRSDDVTPTPTPTPTPLPGHTVATIRTVAITDHTAVPDIEIVVNDSSGNVESTASTGTLGETVVQIPLNGSITALKTTGSVHVAQVFRSIPANATVTILEGVPAPAASGTCSLSWSPYPGAASYALFGNADFSVSGGTTASMAFSESTVDIAVVALDANGATLATFVHRDTAVVDGCAIDLSSDVYSSPALMLGYSAPSSAIARADFQVSSTVGRSVVPSDLALSPPAAGAQSRNIIVSPGASTLRESIVLTSFQQGNRRTFVAAARAQAGSAATPFTFDPTTVPPLTLDSADVAVPSNPRFTWSGASSFGDFVRFQAQFADGASPTIWTVYGPPTTSALSLPQVPAADAAFSPSSTNALAGEIVTTVDLVGVSGYEEWLQNPFAESSDTAASSLTGDER